MNRSEMYRGWSIMIYHVGLPDQSPKCLMIVKGMDVIHAHGTVVDEDQAIIGAKQQIDYLESRDEKPESDDWGDGEFDFV